MTGDSGLSPTLSLMWGACEVIKPKKIWTDLDFLSYVLKPFWAPPPSKVKSCFTWFKGVVCFTWFEDHCMSYKHVIDYLVKIKTVPLFTLLDYALNTYSLNRQWTGIKGPPPQLCISPIDLINFIFTNIIPNLSVQDLIELFLVKSSVFDV